MALSKPAPPKPLSRCRIAFQLKCLGFDISFSAGKSSLWIFLLFDFFFLYLFITELSMSNWRRQNSFSGICNLWESYKAGGSASWSISFLFLFYFITHYLMLKILTYKILVPVAYFLQTIIHSCLQYSLRLSEEFSVFSSIPFTSLIIQK